MVYMVKMVKRVNIIDKINIFYLVIIVNIVDMIYMSLKGTYLKFYRGHIYVNPNPTQLALRFYLKLKVN